MSDNVVLLQGVTGSRAYGLATELSDTDRRGVYALPTRQVLGLFKVERSKLDGKDTLYWEAWNAIKLALNSNQSVMELLFLPRYETITDLGEQLVAMRGSLVSKALVRRSYLYSAESQGAKMRRRLWEMGKMDWRGDREKEEAKIRKQARSIAIYLLQGAQLWQTGNITVRLSDEEIAAVNIASRDPVHLDGLLDLTEAIMDKNPSELRDEPDLKLAEKWLLNVRAQNWSTE